MSARENGSASLTNGYSDTGAQPLVSEDGKRVLAVNGEIYNHIALRKEFGKDVKFKTHSDCEVILPMVSPNRGFKAPLNSNGTQLSPSTSDTISNYARNSMACFRSSY